jgi:hypothetical protein
MKSYEEERREMPPPGIILAMSPRSVTGVRCPPDNLVNFTLCAAGVQSQRRLSSSSGAAMAPLIAFFGPLPTASRAARSARANRDPWSMGLSSN